MHYIIAGMTRNLQNINGIAGHARNDVRSCLSTFVYDAINNAITNGRVRNGVKLGCIIVAASGNGDSFWGAGTGIASVYYPANLPEVIAVGAINCNGVKTNVSNYGADLNVVAPGLDIYTTDWYGLYNPSFWGTSSATPHVAGVAALILSANPDLTRQQVTTIIESTCTKINPSTYIYSSNPAHPYGTWNTYVGHGLVNAQAAVGLAKFSGPSILCTNYSSAYSVPILPAGFSWGSSSNISISGSGSNITAIGTSAGVGYINIKDNLGVEVSRKTIWVGVPDAQLGGPNYVQSYGWYNVQYSPQSNPSFYWSVNLAWPYSLYPSGSTADIYFLSNATYEVSVEAYNMCGCKVSSMNVYASPFSPVKPYPNPANDLLYIDIDWQMISAKYTAAGIAANNPTCEIRLYNVMGMLAYQTTTTGNKVQINVSNLPNGIYFIHFFDGISVKPEIIQVIIKR